MADQRFRLLDVESAEFLQPHHAVAADDRHFGCAAGAVVAHGFGQVVVAFMAVDGDPVVDLLAFEKGAKAPVVLIVVPFEHGVDADHF